MSTPAADPLAGLDSVSWSQLSHAYGPADDVPELLRQLQSDDPEIYMTAGDELVSTIYHQGSRYSSSIAAVPFLYSLLDIEATKGRGFLLQIITHLAVGSPEWSVPKGIDVAKWQARVREIQEPGYCAHEFRTYEAAERGLPSILRCLEDESPNMRATAAFSLAFFLRESGKTTVALSNLFDREIHANVRGTIVLALAIMHAAQDDSEKSKVVRQLESWYEACSEDGNDGITLWSSAIALFILGSRQGEVVEETMRASADEEYLARLEMSIPSDMDFPFAVAGLRSLAEAVVTECKGTSLAEAN
ncbi:hypothetical protein EDB81DRAFT_696071 [Dactylonectria macrodidyma]|uniref:Uncharacterized protein n=1 Tax=Dactylonectria macrodidyma TaxID=307937 RepID=A0A9P9IRU7_9HYPO|nr:hypothetical protein EDB81DRAFT_696071 [Dactylonectria macrodidyma]